jgi:hypothetical protein
VGEMQSKKLHNLNLSLITDTVIKLSTWTGITNWRDVNTNRILVVVLERSDNLGNLGKGKGKAVFVID